MTVPTLTTDRGPQQGTVADWRRLRLQQAGFDEPSSTRLATTPGVDLHQLLDLVHRGCPPQLAERILSPLPYAAP